MSDTNKFIDVKKIFHDKNPRLAALLPSFIVNYVKRIVHEEDINDFIDHHGHKTEFDFVEAILTEFKVRVTYEGLDNIPVNGGFIMAANHPLGGMDAMALLSVVSQRRRDVKFIVNDILMQLKNLKGLFIGVNKHGKNAQESLAAIDALYASNMGVLIFPAGLVSRKQSGVIKDLEWKKSFVTKAKKYQRNIIPVHIEGANTNRFYNIANFRKRIGIKANIEMFFLADEMFKQANKTIAITIGKPVPFETFTDEKNDTAWADRIKNSVYELKKNKQKTIDNC